LVAILHQKIPRGHVENLPRKGPKWETPSPCQVLPQLR
jgi:hypothetical protein